MASHVKIETLLRYYNDYAVDEVAGVTPPKGADDDDAIVLCRW